MYSKFKCVVPAVVLFVLCMSQFANGQSLWQRRNPQFANLFVDSRAHACGDLLTVLIAEATDVLKRDQRALDKSSDGGFNFNFAGASSSGAASSANLNVAGDSSRSFGGNSQYRVAQEFSDRLTVRVMQVLPNGDLVVEGKRRRIIADEQRELHLTGVVRPIDIGPDNTIRSQFVADLDIQYLACGSESHFTNQGWAARALNRIWPF